MACGTPAITFDLGGPKEIVDHMINGYCAIPEDPVSLAKGIDWVLTHPEPKDLSTNARQAILGNFDSMLIAEQYRELYKRHIECDN